MKNFVKEFKEFITKGNVLDLAIGVIIGGAFTAIVTSLVNDIITPLLGIITGGIDFSDLKIQLGEESYLMYGSFISAVINFLIIAFIIFLFIKAINKFKKKKEEAPAAPKRICPFCKCEVADDATRCPHCTSELPEEEEEKEEA